MIRKLIDAALSAPLIVLLLTFTLAAAGIYAFLNVNVEAYPDPAPAIIEVVAQYPGASAEEVERQVTVPLEVALAGMPGLSVSRTRSLFGLSHMRNQFEYGTDFKEARQEVINRLQFVQGLPPGVTANLSPQSPTGEIFRYTLRVPKGPDGQEIYTLNDIKALQDWVLEREFRRVPRIIDVTSSGGTVKRYEVHPDPNLMRRYGVTLAQLQTTLQNSNTNIGGDIIDKGAQVVNVRGVGLIGGGEDPATQVLGLTTPEKAYAFLKENNLLKPDEHSVSPPEAARRYLRFQEEQRVREIRQLVIPGAVYIGRWGNRKSVTIDDIVDGGPVSAGEPLGVRGVIVGHQTRLGRVSLSQPPPPAIFSLGKQASWRDEPDKVQSIVLMRKGEFTRPALEAVEERVKELNDPESGRLLPGVQIEKYYDRSELIGITTDTVEENLLVGMFLVVVILLMFLSNVRIALIVAINIPLALLFAFSVLFFRGKSANLLSIGAVDFGIIVDSSVIIVENIYRHLSSGDDAHLPLKERILKAAGEMTKALIFSTLIMVCAFLPLFTMTGPEGQLFGPRAETYAFALGGALVLALTLSPVLCLLFLRSLKPAADNIMVRGIKRAYLSVLALCLRHRTIALSIMACLFLATALRVPLIGREFMPELEEGNLWITATFPANVSMKEVGDKIEVARKVMAGDPTNPQVFPGFKEVEVLVPAIGRPDDGTDPTGYYRSEIFAPLRPEKDWPMVREEKGWKAWTSGWSVQWGPRGWPRLVHTRLRPRTKVQLVEEMNAELRAKVPGVDWNFSQYIRDNVTEAMSGVKGDNSVKIFGPDLDKLEELGDQIKNVLTTIDGIRDVGVFKIMGQSNLEFRIDLDKCKRYGVTAADVNNLIATAVGGKAMSTMIEGEKSFDITLRLPPSYRSSESDILNIPLDISNGQVLFTPSAGSIATEGSSTLPPPQVGSQTDTSNNPTNISRVTLRDLVSPVGKDGRPDSRASFEKAAASIIYRENGKRQIAVKFSVRDRDLAGAVAEAREKTRDLIQSPYRTEWAGEFQEMEQAERKLMIIIPVSMALIFLLLYMAFHSVLDAVVALSNVLALSMGGIWALWLTSTNFSISAAVGFVSLFGVAIMDGLIMISSFNANRAHGMPLREAIMDAAAKRVRPLTMTALTAILGLLPAALSTRIGAQTQRPLAIVVVGGMLTTLFLTRFLMPMLYSLYGHREPPAGSGHLAH